MNMKESAIFTDHPLYCQILAEMVHGELRDVQFTHLQLAAVVTFASTLLDLTIHEPEYIIALAQGVSREFGASWEKAAMQDAPVIRARGVSTYQEWIQRECRIVVGQYPIPDQRDPGQEGDGDAAV